MHEFVLFNMTLICGCMLDFELQHFVKGFCSTHYTLSYKILIGDYVIHIIQCLFALQKLD